MSHDRSEVFEAAVRDWVNDVLANPPRPAGPGPHPHRRAGITMWTEVDGRPRETADFLLLDLDPEEARIAAKVSTIPYDGYVGTLRLPPPDEPWLTLLVHARLLPGNDHGNTHIITVTDTEETP